MERNLRENCHYGPYAMLVREIAFNSQVVGNHDYLKIPEIIEDMCMDVQKVYGVDALNRFVKKRHRLSLNSRKS